MATSLHPWRPFLARPAFAGPWLAAAASLLLGFAAGSSRALAQGAPPAPAAPPTAAPPAPAPTTPPSTPASTPPAAPAAEQAPAAPAEKPPAAPAEKPPAGEEVSPPATKPEPAWQTEPRTRRFGFTFGFAGGPLLGTAAGFPNDVKKIGRERYYTETGIGVGVGGNFWLGGALTDWLTFGFGVGGATLTAGDHATTNYAFLFHTDVFPLFPLGGIWREVGVTLDTGLGTAATTRSGSESKLIDGGATSRIGGGVFYEWLRFWKVSTGPWVYADYTWSSSVREGGVYLGWRTALYSKP